eukprot:1656309-Pyramimonas_sp.AAC.1
MARRLARNFVEIRAGSRHLQRGACPRGVFLDSAFKEQPSTYAGFSLRLHQRGMCRWEVAAGRKGKL